MTREQLEMLKRLMELEFTAVDLNLFLNTHPDCREALADYNQTTSKLMDLKMEYQEEYGPISAMHPTYDEYYWSYLETDWPWQIDY
ncbi:spore coat protein CotJB [Halanaerobaculum tunisiense]